MYRDDITNTKQKFFGGSRGAIFQKSPPGSLRQRILFFLILLFFTTCFIGATGQYKILSWKGEVKIKQGDTYIQLSKQSKIVLKQSDAFWIADGASLQLLFPDGVKKSFRGPRLTRIESLEKNRAKIGPSILANFIKITGIEELFSREMEDVTGATKGDDLDGSLSFYDELKKAMKEVEQGLINISLVANKAKQMNETLAYAETHFDAAPLEKQMLMKARILKHFGQHKQALMVVFNHYEEILKANGKQIERELLEDFLFNEFLPIVVTINSPTSFSSNLELWWAAFAYDGRELNVVEKTIDHSLHPENTFKLDRSIDNTGKRTEEVPQAQCFFIVACADWSELEKFDDMEYARKNLLENGIKETKEKTVTGYGKVIIQLCF